jgi:SAM-dependent methyltransferase
MLGNLVNRHDPVRVLQKLRLGQGAAMLARVARDRRGRVEAAWAEPAASNSQWWAIWGVQQRWRTKVCGRPDVDFPQYVCDRYLPAAKDLIGLAPGCGGGYYALRWADWGIFRRLDAFDISPPRIDAAREEAARRNLDGSVRFSVGDIARLELPEDEYDVILAEQVLHHFSPLDEVLTRLARCLKPGGILYVDEYVGPSRHQWTERQLSAANALLALLPDRYRRMEEGRRKDRVIRPSILRMVLTDPSEAIESACILPLVREHFEIVHQRGYGGTLLQLVFDGIAHNFRDDSSETQRWLALCFAAEDALLATGDVPDDFVVAVCRPRRGRDPRSGDLLAHRPSVISAAFPGSSVGRAIGCGHHAASPGNR